jgi:hypothetical protein
MNHRFIKSEDGAITVDWVVLTFGVTITGLAMMGTIGPSLGRMAVSVVDALESTVSSIYEGSKVVGFRSNYDFAGDTSAWNGATSTYVDGFGEVLGPIAGSGGLESVTTSFNIGENAESATLTFDLLAFDSLDGEDAVLYIDGVEVGRMTALQGMMTWVPGDVEGISLSAQVLSQGEHLGGMQNDPSQDWWRDGASRITITVDDPGATLDFGFGSTANQGTSDESWGLDNFIIETTVSAGQGGGGEVATNPSG